MTEEEMNFSRTVNVDKAIKKVPMALSLIVFSILTYIMPLILGEFDFGIVFEIISLISLIIARIYMSKYDEDHSKMFITCAMASIGWIIIYDIIVFLSFIDSIYSLADISYSFIFGEFLSLLYLSSLFAINKDLSKADNPIKYKESTDWFYEKYEDDKTNEK